MLSISSITACKLSFPLPAPISITDHTLTSQEHLIIQLHSASGLIGWGEASPFKPITGDSMEEVLIEFGNLSPTKLSKLNTTVDFYDKFVADLQCATLRTALDCACYDLSAKFQQLPLYKYLSNNHFTTPNSVTIFLQEDPKESRKNAEKFFELYPDLKVLKIKLCGSGDFERCKAIQQVTPNHINYVLDANQAFKDPYHAVSELQAIVNLLGDVILIEEPCPRGDLHKLRFVRERISDTLIFADESCCGEADLIKLIESEAADGINIKLQKIGGITPAARLAKRALANGLEIMIGQMFESPLSTSAAVHFAHATPGVILTDLDMDLPYPENMAVRSPFIAGTRIPLNIPGIGSEINPAYFKEQPICLRA